MEQQQLYGQHGALCKVGQSYLGTGGAWWCACVSGGDAGQCLQLSAWPGGLGMQQYHGWEAAAHLTSLTVIQTRATSHACQ